MDKLSLPKGTIVPNHIAVILDGNGRWARAHGLPTTKGHEAGAVALEHLLENCRRAGVHTLTIWGFSTENWKRPPKEVSKIMDLVGLMIKKHLKDSKKEGVRFIHIGSKERLPRHLAILLKRAEEETKNNKKYILNLALDYGGRDEIVRAVKKIIKAGVPAESVNEELFASYLDTAGQPYPYPDLLIRTSGEQRTSGLMPWQMAYSEFYFEEDHLPDMTTTKLRKILLDYSRRRSRFGGKDRVEHLKFKPEVAARLELNWWRLSKIPEGKTFEEYATEHIREQWGLSLALAGRAAKHMVLAFRNGKREHWRQADVNLRKFYRLIKDEVKLAFEPSIAASLQVRIWQKTENGSKASLTREFEDTTRELVTEVYRISDYQATKVAHLRALATIEKNLAEHGEGAPSSAEASEHWDRAEEYLHLYYKALKDKVA